MRSVALTCPGCFALYEAHYDLPVPGGFRCRICGSQLEETTGAAETLSDEKLAQSADRLTLVHGSWTDLRIWLDDDLEDRRAPEGWFQVVSAHDAIRMVDTGRVVELSLDHDLGDDEVRGRGIDVIDFIVEQQEAHGRPLWPRDAITLHTANPYGRDAMARAIRRYAPRFRRLRETRTRGGHLRFRFGPKPRENH